MSALPFTQLDDDGGRTEAGELRTSYNETLDRTYVISDQEDFQFFVDGDRTFALNYDGFDHFIFGAQNYAGSEGNDRYTGSNFNDTIDGGAGRDTLTGGEGDDVFVFSDATHSSSVARDAITDFTIGSDLIDLTALSFTGFDTDGGYTEAGELRLIYSEATNRTYVKNDQEDFLFYFKDADLTDGSLTEDSFLF